MAKISLKKKDSAVPEKAKAKEKAGGKEAAIEINERFEAKLEELHQAREAWEEGYPEAKEALDEVKKIEDECQELLKEAKPLMGASGEKEIGDFKMQYPETTPTYDGKRLLKLLVKLKGESVKDKADRFDVIVDLFERGLLTEVNVDSKVAGLVKNLASMKFLDSAWVPSEKMSPRVTVPKI